MNDAEQMSGAERRWFETVFDISPRRERLHDRDCASCDLAADIAGTLSAFWDPRIEWHETEVADGLPGDTLLIQANRIVAHVLHRRAPDYQRPPDEVIQRDIREDNERRAGT